MVLLFVFVFYVLLRRNFFINFVNYSISITLCIKLSFVIIGFFVGIMAIIGSLSGSDTFHSYVLRATFDVF